jgi:hypothetical protein
MQSFLKQLDHCIQRQQHLYQALKDLFIAERSAILISDVERLNRIVVDKERVLKDIGAVEVQRHHNMQQLATCLEEDAAALTLARLCGLIEEPMATMLKRAGRDLQNLVEAIQTESERNRSLCLQALQFINGSIQMITNLIDPQCVYQSSGKMGNERPVGRMLSGAV